MPDIAAINSLPIFFVCGQTASTSNATASISVQVLFDSLKDPESCPVLWLLFLFITMP
jgi:hypothetical protein